MDKFQDIMKARDTVSSTIPAVCYNVCNNANLEAQSRGKVPELCEPDSAFNNYVSQCNNCTEQNADQTETSGRQYSDDAFAQYLNFCAAIEASSTLAVTQPTTTIPTSWLTWYETFEPTTMFDLPRPGASTSPTTVVYRSINITSTMPAYFLHVSAQSLISTYIPPAVFSELAASVASAAAMASVTGDATSLVYAALEDTSRPPWFSSAVPSTYAAQMSTLEASLDELKGVSRVDSTQEPASTGMTSTGMASTGSSSRTWIAGAVVGSVAGAALILLGMFLFLRRRRRATRIDKQPDIQYGDSTYMTGGKPELHSDPVPPPARVYEMDASQNLSEMAVQEKPQELDAEQVKKPAGEPAREPQI